MLRTWFQNLPVKNKIAGTAGELTRLSEGLNRQVAHFRL